MHPGILALLLLVTIGGCASPTEFHELTEHEKAFKQNHDALIGQGIQTAFDELGQPTRSIQLEEGQLYIWRYEGTTVQVEDVQMNPIEDKPKMDKRHYCWDKLVFADMTGTITAWDKAGCPEDE